MEYSKSVQGKQMAHVVDVLGVYPAQCLTHLYFNMREMEPAEFSEWANAEGDVQEVAFAHMGNPHIAGKVHNEFNPKDYSVTDWLLKIAKAAELERAEAN